MKTRLRIVAALLSVCSLVLTTPAVVAQQDNLVQHGTFEVWADGAPVGWDLGIGANNGGDSPKSVARQGEGPSLELSGDASTLAWQSVSQDVPVTAGNSYRLSYVIKTTDVRREVNQYDNCFVGVFQKDRRGQLVSRDFWSSNITEFTPASAVFRAGDNVAVAQVLVFLSKSGTLNVKDISLVELGDADNFDILVDDMNRHYSYFELKGIDWPELTAKYRDRAKAAADTDEFVDVVTDMLAEMKDVHTWVVHDGKRKSKFRSGFDANFNFQVVDRDLDDIQRIGRFGLVGKTEDGLGYVRINTLAGIDDRALREMIGAIEGLFDAPGIIMDLRRNQGGDETIAMKIAAMFIEDEHVYARQQYRATEDHSAFYETPQRVITPRDGSAYTGPIVCLIGPGAVSSGEGFAMMMAAIPHCTTMGLPTRGASGNPAPIKLPNGVDVWYSRWMSLMPDGTPIEDAGVPPDVVVEHGDGDPTWERAREELK